ncbi:MAG: hypothetical protein KatS3mg030_347 [Saprospiraceae bacterium]|nr:MAG: hypothetical protein KatS3mg030_347 [Saprospiraceae bacterium]
MKKALWLLVGFGLFFLGALSIILNMVGVDFTFLAWLDQMGRLTAFLIKVVMAVGGIVIIYLNSVDWRNVD